MSDRLSRRDFLKVAGAGAAVGVTSNTSDSLLRGIPEEKNISSESILPTPGDIIAEIRSGRERNAKMLMAAGLLLSPYGSWEKKTLAATALAVSCDQPPKPPSNVQKKPTPTQEDNVIKQATALPTEISPLTGQTPSALEAIPTTEPNPGKSSIIEGLNVGEVTPGNTVGMVPGYETTGINTLYDPNDPPTTITKPNGEEIEAIPPRAFGIDQDQLITLFRANKNERGEMVGEYNGTSVTLKNGIWRAPTGETFIPFIKAEPGTDAVFIVMDANGDIQKVDITGKAIDPPTPMFETPQAIASRMKFKNADKVVGVEMNKNGSLAFITEEARPTEKDPNRMVQIVNEVAFLGEPEDLSKNAAAEASAVAFSGALLGAGITLAAEEIKREFTVMRVEGLDPTDPTKQKKKNYDIATVAVDDAKVGGDYPLMIKNEGGEWKPTSFKNLADLNGLAVGTTIEQWTETYLKELNSGFLYYDWTYENAVHDNEYRINTLAKDAKIKDFTLGHLLDPRLISPDVAKLIGQDKLDAIEKHAFDITSKFGDKVARINVANEPHAGLSLDEVIAAFKGARRANKKALLGLSETANYYTKGAFTDQTKTIVKQLKDLGLIDYLAVEGHDLQYQNEMSRECTSDDIAETLKSYGMPILISEFDINTTWMDGSQPEKYAKQAERAQTLLGGFLKSGVVMGLNFWGIDDKDSWLVKEDYHYNDIGGSKNADPLPFHNGKKKLFYFMVQKALFDMAGHNL